MEGEFEKGRFRALGALADSLPHSDETDRLVNELINRHDSGMTQAFLTSESQHWGTPWAVVRALEAQEGLQFTLDVAATETTAKAPKFYTEVDNAFRHNWYSDADTGAVWCNPPYGDKRFPVRMWVERACLFRKQMTTVLLLPANKTDQDWFHDFVLPFGEYRPVRGRIGFLGPDGTPMKGNSQGSMLIFFGPNYGPTAPKSFDWKAIRKL